MIIDLWFNYSMNISHTTLAFKQYSENGIESVSATTAIEAPVSLTVNGKVWLTFQCSPDYLEQLAVGFLYNEGFIKSMKDVSNIHVCDKRDNVDVWLEYAAEKPETWRRTSGCHGGTTSADLEVDEIIPISEAPELSIANILELVGSFLDNQPPRSESGGVHTSALANGKNILFYQEDIGRHNTFDKIAGRMIMENIKPEVPIILTTGRVSSDMMQKAIRLRTPYLISMRSTSSVSIELARQWGITLICGARKSRVNVFAHENRILVEDYLRN